MKFFRSFSIVYLPFLFLSLLTTTSCEREERGFRVEAPSASRINSKQLSNLQPGQPTLNPPVKNEYEENAYAMAEGKRLYSYMNCVGCHAHGGGDIGPPLMDEKWIYGGQPEQIFATIVEGRPNGMPSFRGKIPDYQVWQIVAYVRSMSGQVPFDAAPARNDNMKIKKPENSVETAKPIKNSGIPKSAEMPQ
jgi:cytochrome c oxidase cbb3-type subunit III